MMAVEGWLWIGTGRGTVFIFSVARAVAEPQLVIQQLAQTTKTEECDTEVQNHQSETERRRGSQGGGGGGGLVAKELAGEETTLEDSDDGAVAHKSDEGVDRRKGDRRIYRRPPFGRTLRGPSTRPVVQRSPAVFKLVYKKSYHLIERESVKVILPLWLVS